MWSISENRNPLQPKELQTILEGFTDFPIAKVVMHLFFLMCTQSKMNASNWHSILSHIPASWTPHVLGMLSDIRTTTSDIPKKLIASAIRRLSHDPDPAMAQAAAAIYECDPALFPPLSISSSALNALAAVCGRFLACLRTFYEATDRAPVMRDSKCWYALRTKYHRQLWERLESEYFAMANAEPRPFMFLAEAEEAAVGLYERTTALMAIRQQEQQQEKQQLQQQQQQQLQQQQQQQQQNNN